MILDIWYIYIWYIYDIDRKSYNDVSSFGTDLWCQTLPEYDFYFKYYTH